MDLSRWAQLDTTSDAWYFGIWANKGKRQVLKYIEGDIYFVEADSDESYDAEIEALCRFHEPAPAAIAIDETSETRFFQNRAELFIDPARAAACGADQLPALNETEES
ncbi:MAG: hypothetical protein HC897_07950 [Thermoanaerobaculia bacterium]|nr:hypothetical protein [Thermoanaerobaculia bacterium]